MLRPSENTKEGPRDPSKGPRRMVRDVRKSREKRVRGGKGMGFKLQNWTRYWVMKSITWL